MDQFIIDGGRKLRGKVRVSGAKNAALPILIATLLTDDPCEISNIPDSRDIRTTRRLLESLGKKVVVGRHSTRVLARRRLKLKAPYDVVKQMRASVLAAGPLLARFGRVTVPLPGGCAIGVRPIDIHLKAFSQLGARRIYEHGDIILQGVLKGTTLRLRFPSVGATQNLMMAASVARGRTRIENAAKEPEMADLGVFLNSMGARVKGAGTSTIIIDGRDRLHGAKHAVIPDRLETGTFLLACAAVGGRITVIGALASQNKALIQKLKQAGARVKETPQGLTLAVTSQLKGTSIVTEPHPGFPTDLQAQWMAVMSVARGSTRVRETVFENRFLHIAELARMGAQIKVSGRVATVEGVAELNGAPVMASDIRAGAALLIAAIAAKGRTKLQRVYHIDRGHERIETKLRSLGVRIRRVKA